MDGVDVRDASLHDVRKNIAFVSQHPVLFHGTIMENIRLGRQDATDDEVVAAARAAAADGFIMGMPDGYQTMLGDGGLMAIRPILPRAATPCLAVKNSGLLLQGRS